MDNLSLELLFGIFDHIDVVTILMMGTSTSSNMPYLLDDVHDYIDHNYHRVDIILLSELKCHIKHQYHIKNRNAILNVDNYVR